MRRKILVISTALLLTFVLCSCGEKPEANDTPPLTEALSEQETESSVTEALTEVAVEDETSTTEEATTEPTVSIPKTTEEIVEYFNECINRVKPEAKSVLNTITLNYLAGSCKIPKWADSLMKILGGADKFIDDTLRKNCNENTLLGTKDDIMAHFPVEGESYGSKLTASDVSSASCTEKDGIITIKLTTIGDPKSSSAKHGNGHAPKAFNVVMPATINDNVPDIAKDMIGGEASVAYPPATVTVQIDAATGHVLNADYDDKWTIYFGDSISLPFGTHAVFTINW